MEEFVPGDILISKTHKGVYYLVVKYIGGPAPKDYVYPEVALIILSSTGMKEYAVPSLCAVFSPIGSVNWVTQEGVRTTGFTKTGVNIAEVLQKIGEKFELA